MLTEEQKIVLTRSTEEALRPANAETYIIKYHNQKVTGYNGKEYFSTIGGAKRSLKMKFEWAADRRYDDPTFFEAGMPYSEKREKLREMGRFMMGHIDKLIKDGVITFERIQ
jgi:hypothetical protein